MTLRIDRAGRVVLPKPVRDRFGLKAGNVLEIQETAEGLMLKPVRQRPSLVTRDGLLVHRGKMPKGFDWSRSQDDLKDRMRRLAGRIPR